jgi:hypothetical protein
MDAFGCYRVSAVNCRGDESDLSDSVTIVVCRPEDPGQIYDKHFEEEPSLPDVTELLGNYPNPFNNATIVSFNIAIGTDVNISVYNINGQLVETICDEIKEPGRYSMRWDAGDFPSGMYFIKFATDEVTQVRKLTLLK